MQKNNVFLLNPENADILNGERRIPNKPKKMSQGVKLILVIGSLAYLALTIFSVMWMVSTLNDWAALNERGITVEGRLIGRDTSIIRSQGSGPRSSSVIRYLLYTYTVGDGQTLEGKVQVREEAYQDYVYNTPVQVLYLEDSPEISRLVGENTLELARFPIFAGVGTSLMVLIVAVTGLQDFRQRRRNQRYEHEGRVIYGRVVAPIFNESESRGKRITMLYLNYEITSPATSKVIPKMQGQRRDDLTQADLPLVGSRVAVLYIHDRLFTVL